MHGHRHRGELVGPDLEQLVARIRLEELQDVLAAVGAGREARLVDDLIHRLAQERDLPHRVGVGRCRIEAEESPLSRDATLVVESLHADVVEVGRSVHRRATVRGGEDEDSRLTRALEDLGCEGRTFGGLVLIGAQDAEARARHRPEELATVVVGEVVLAVAEEREVVVGEPVEECGRLLTLSVAHGRGPTRPQLIRE